MAFDGMGRGTGSTASRETSFLERLLDAIRQAHELFLNSEDASPVFHYLLDSLVEITESQYGFLDEIRFGTDGSRYKINRAIAGVPNEGPSKALFDELEQRNHVFAWGETLAGTPGNTGKPVVVNSFSSHMFQAPMPSWHPHLDSFLGLPLKFGGELLGIAGIANRAGGYDEAMATELGPFLSTCASIMQACRQREQQQRQTEELQESARTLAALLEVSSETSYLIKKDGTILNGNDVFARRLGHEIAEMRGNSLYDYFPRELAISRKAKIQESIRLGRPLQWEDIRAGRVYLHRVAPVPNAAGDVDRVAGFASDITEMSRAQQTLRENEARVRAKLDAILTPNGDLSQLELGDVINVPAIQSIMELLYRITHIGVALIDVRGSILVSTGWQDICTKYHRVHPTTRKNCQESDTELSLGVKAGSFRAYKCKNHLWDVSTPVMVGGRHMGNIFLGQFLFEGEEPDYEVFRTQARKFGFDETEYMASLDRIPRYSKETVSVVMSMYAQMGDLISSLSLNNIQLARTLEMHKRTEEDLRRANAFLDSIIENIPLMVFLKEPEELRFVRFNKAGERLLGRKREELLGRNDYDFFPPEQANFFIEKDREVLRGKKLLDIAQEPLESADRGTRVLHTVKVPVMGANGEAEYLLGISEDITERMATEEALRKSEAKHKALAEENAALAAQSRKDAEATSILLHEVNHRVKNNMMAVIGLLYAQRRFIPEEMRADFQAAMTDLAGRVETLALVHGMLSAAKWGPLPLSRLFREILNAASKLVPYGKTLSYSFEGEDVQIPAQTINSVALLLFEVATNTIKHAFRTREHVEVELTGRWSEAGFRMRYRDNGPGFPAEVLEAGRSNLGLYLVKTLASHDLRGEVTFLNDSGAVVELQLRPEASVQRIDSTEVGP